MPLNLKPVKPESYDGKRDSLTVESWLYQVEQYLALVQVGAPETHINDVRKISYAFITVHADGSDLVVYVGSNWKCA
jgi:hypothetical protein